MTCALVLLGFSNSYGLTPNVAEDFDFDGYSNRLEPAAGSDPLNPEDDPFIRGWSNLGLYGGQVYSIDIDASNPDKIIMFAGTYFGDGLFRSRDGGNTWEPVLTGYEGGVLDDAATFRNSAVWAVEAVEIADNDPNTPNTVTVWAVHNQYAAKSTDGGENWTHIDNRSMQQVCSNCGGAYDGMRFCNALAIDPDDPQTVYVGTGGPDGTYPWGAIYRTNNGGMSWTKTGFDDYYEFDYSVEDIAIDPANPSIIWAITDSYGAEADFGSLYRSDNSGATWTHVFDIATKLYDIEIWPKDSSVILIASQCGILSNFSGDWDYLFGSCSNPARALDFDPQNPDVLYATAGATGVIRAVYDPDVDDFIFGRQADLNLTFFTLTVHPTTGNTIFAGEGSDGIFKLTYDNASDGFSVSEKNNGINALIIYDIDVNPAAGPNPAVMIAASGRGVAVRLDDEPWTLASGDELPKVLTFAVAFDPLSEDGSGFYAGGEGYLAKTFDRGNSWDNLDNDIPYDFWINHIAVAPNGTTLYLAGQQYGEGGEGRIYKSTDGGVSFGDPILVSSDFSFNTVIIDPTNSDHLFAGGGNFFAPAADGHLYESINGGDSWTLTGLTDTVVNALLIDPDDPDIIYAGCGSGGGTMTPLFKSSDGGDNWQPSYAGMPGRPTRYGVWGSSDLDVFMLGHTGSASNGGYDDMKILHYSGTDWTDQQTGTLDHLHGIWGRSNQDIIAVGNRGAIVHYDGNRWSPMEAENNRTTQRNLNAGWGHGESDRYAVGDGGTILRYSSDVWNTMTSPTESHLYGIWGPTDGSRAYAVGSTGTILKYSGGIWVPDDSGVRARLSGIWGTPDGTHIFVTGDPEPDGQGSIRYTILRSNGNGWTRMNTPIVVPGRGRLHSVWGFSDSNVFAVGDGGVVLHYDGNDWTPMISGTSADLFDVWGSGMPSVYVVGRYGTILLYNGSQWSSIDTVNGGEPVEGWTHTNSVTDLKFKLDPGGNHIAYAATDRQGIYLSPNQAGFWINLLSPPYTVYALEVGSIIVGSYGIYAFKDLGKIVGEVKDALTGVGLTQATVSTESGVSDTTNSQGIYVLHLGAGLYNITGDAEGYKPETAYNVPSMLGGNVVNFYLSDPPIFVKIDDTDILGTNGVFEGAAGSIRPVDGEYGWTESGDSGYLQVPYPYGWVKLAIEPHAGNQIMDVLVNGGSQGPVTEYSFNHPSTSQRIEAFFGPLTNLCKADINQDGDVDGSDAADFALGVQNGATIVDLAGELGRTDCLP